MDDILKLNWSWYTIRQSKKSSKYFDATFFDNKDIFFQHLNEIQDFSHSESDTESCNTNNECSPIDPRNQNQITEIALDYSSSAVRKSVKKSEVLANLTRASTLTKEEHEVGLKALESFTQVNELIATKCHREWNEFNKFLANWLATQPCRYYELIRFIYTQYRKIFSQESETLKNQPDQFYLIQTAIMFGENNDNVVQYSVGDCLRQDGHVLELQPSFQFDRVLKWESTGITEMKFPDSVYLRNLEHSHVNVILPESTLHFLLSPSTCPDIWEIKFKVVESDCLTNNQIFFERPLPLRCQNRYVRTATLEKLVKCCIQREGRGSILSLNDGSITTNCSNDKIINAVDLNRDYRIEEYYEFLSRLRYEKERNFSGETNTILREWTMGKTGDGDKANAVKILTESTIPYFVKEEEGPTYVNLSLKLEYKTGFGAEVMTKDELILEWLRQFLIGNGYTIRVRLDADTSEHVLTQRLDLKDIEAELFHLYKTKPENVLSSLNSILSIIQNFPTGQYLLKFNPKFDDKLMIYLKTEKRSPNGLSLHELYGNFQIKIDNLQTCEYIPIDGNVVTSLHSTFQIMPCCFPYWLPSTATKNQKDYLKPMMKTRKVWKKSMKTCILPNVQKNSIVSSGSHQVYKLRPRMSDVICANHKGIKKTIIKAKKIEKMQKS